MSNPVSDGIGLIAGAFVEPDALIIRPAHFVDLRHDLSLVTRRHFNVTLVSLRLRRVAPAQHRHERQRADFQRQKTSQGQSLRGGLRRQRCEAGQVSGGFAASAASVAVIFPRSISRRMIATAFGALRCSQPHLRPIVPLEPSASPIDSFP